MAGDKKMSDLRIEGKVLTAGTVSDTDDMLFRDVDDPANPTGALRVMSMAEFRKSVPSIFEKVEISAGVAVVVGDPVIQKNVGPVLGVTKPASPSDSRPLAGIVVDLIGGAGAVGQDVLIQKQGLFDIAVPVTGAIVAGDPLIWDFSLNAFAGGWRHRFSSDLRKGFPYQAFSVGAGANVKLRILPPVNPNQVTKRFHFKATIQASIGNVDLIKTLFGAALKPADLFESDANDLPLRVDKIGLQFGTPDTGAGQPKFNLKSGAASILTGKSPAPSADFMLVSYPMDITTNLLDKSGTDALELIYDTAASANANDDGFDLVCDIVFENQLSLNIQ